MGKPASMPSADTPKVVPPVPLTVENTDLNAAFLADLTLKTVYADTDCTTDRVAGRLRLPPSVTETLLLDLYREKFIEIRGKAAGNGHRYGMLERGWQRAQRLLEVSGYIGPAPVSLPAYTMMSDLQERERPSVTPEAIQAALGDLILPEGIVRTVGLAASSRRSLFITGPPGTGKTTIATSIHTANTGDYWIPYAIEVDGQVIKMLDAHSHRPLPAGSTPYDQRWIRTRRPLVIVGGEMTIETMDLIYSPTVRFYEAPFQMKANGGTLVIDDFGRQRVDPRDLLNRWIIPLESRMDYLTLHTGKKIQVPFEQFVIFATNLDPAALVDDAFLRRIGYRLRMEHVAPETYGRIFRRYAEKQGLGLDGSLVDRLLGWYQHERRPLVPCEPRDLLQRCIDICRYENRPHVVTPDLLELTWTNYFGRPPGQSLPAPSGHEGTDGPRAA
jgi:hypothetical protein